MTGHVDGIGVVRGFSRVGPQPDASVTLTVEAPAALARFIAPKGSIAVDGVSLTVNQVQGDSFEMFIIPHTREVTTLGRLVAGARVNLEVDMVARYIERIVNERERE